MHDDRIAWTDIELLTAYLRLSSGPQRAVRFFLLASPMTIVRLARFEDPD